MIYKKLITGASLAAVMITSALLQASDNSHVTKFSDIAWQNAGIEGVEMSVLWGNETDGSAVYAFRIQPGVTIPAHLHSSDYRGIAIQGNWEHIDQQGNAVITAQDAFAHIKAEDLHADRCAGPEVCINLLDFDGHRDFIVPEEVIQE